MVKALSTVPDATPPGLALEYAVDRLRDLVRRGLLMRMCLATVDDAGEEHWRLGDDVGVDAALADDSKRTEWRGSWRDRLAGFGASAAAERATPLTDIVSAR
jgi:hypothetical protein